MPQLRALSAVNPESEHFRRGARQRHHQRDDVPVFGRRWRRWRTLRRRRTPVHLRPGSADPHRRLDLGRHGHRPHRGRAPDLSRRSADAADAAARSPDAILDMIPGGAGATGFTAAKRTYDQQVAKITEFFEQARQYQKERAAKAPGFKPVLKMEAMMPVLEGKVPLAVSAARASVIHDAIAFAEKQKIKIVILQPRDIAKAGPELKAKNSPGDSRPRAGASRTGRRSLRWRLHATRRGLQGRREVRLRHLQQRIRAQPALPGGHRGRVRTALRRSAEGRHHQRRPDLGPRQRNRLRGKGQSGPT